MSGRTTISFTRPRVTSESSPTDIALDHPVYFLWAVGGSVNFDSQSIGYHLANRGRSSQTIELPSAVECPPIGKIDASVFMGAEFISM